jgi:hypothetical protein
MSEYVDPAPETKLGRMRVTAHELLREHEAAGTLPTSVRFIYYELVARGVCSKARVDSRAPTHLLIGALTDLRKAGVVPWEWIVDETRSLDDFTGAGSIEEWVGDAVEHARLDPWRGAAPLVLCESRSLAGALRRTSSRYAVRVAATNGQVGGFLHTDVAPALSPGDRVLYFGDHDLAGDDIERNTRDVLERSIGSPEWRAAVEAVGTRVVKKLSGDILKWERLALTEQQVRRYRLPVIEKRDRRFKDGRGVHEAVETEALSQQLIVAILERRLAALLPEPLEAVLRREERQRRAMQRTLSR